MRANVRVNTENGDKMGNKCALRTYSFTEQAVKEMQTNIKAPAETGNGEDDRTYDR